MISSPLSYLALLAFVATLFAYLQKREPRLFEYLPVAVIIYALSMAAGSFGLFERNEAIEALYTTAKSNLLPAMLFLMLLGVDFSSFFRLGRSLLLAYIVAVASLFIAFIVVVYCFGFDADTAAAFGALGGSWMGGSANMIAVGSVLGVSENAFGYGLIVDSVNYTWWFIFLLFITPYAAWFDRKVGSKGTKALFSGIGCSCEMGAKRYWLIVALSLGASLLSQMIGEGLGFINTTTSVVITATLLGIAASFTPLRNLNGTSEVANTMLYLLIALIGSQAVIESAEGLGLYVAAGAAIIVLHALLMVAGAKLFGLDLFSIAVASLANIGGIASAPVLAASYHKNLVGVGVLMAVMGYIVGTLGGIVLGNLLVAIAR